MYKRIWYRVSCNFMVFQWIQFNGYKSIRNNLVFFVRSGRTGFSFVLGGKECQFLFIVRFIRIQVSGGVLGFKGSFLFLGVIVKVVSIFKSKESFGGGFCVLWTVGFDGYRQIKFGYGSEQYGGSVQLFSLKFKQEVSFRIGFAVGGGGFSRSVIFTFIVIVRAGFQFSVNSRLGDKYVIFSTGVGFGFLNKYSVSDFLKVKFSFQFQGQLYVKGDGGFFLFFREFFFKVGQELRSLVSCGAGFRGNVVLQVQFVLYFIKSEFAFEGYEKRLDIFNIFKTYILKDFVFFYQSWGVNGFALEYRGKTCGFFFRQFSWISLRGQFSWILRRGGFFWEGRRVVYLLCVLVQKGVQFIRRFFVRFRVRQMCVVFFVRYLVCGGVCLVFVGILIRGFVGFFFWSCGFENSVIFFLC